MLFRGVGARRLVSFTIFLLTVLVVSGAVVATGFARATGVPQGSAGALVLLGLVGIATQAVESVRRREPDLALARLRGRHGPRLLLFAVAEPGVVVVGGAVVGVGVGWLLTRAVFGAWLPTGTSYTIGRREWTTVAIITLAVLVIVAASCWSVLRAPLHSQLAGARRPRGAGTVGLFLQLLLILGAVIALYQSQQAVRSRVDWVTLISPAVVGLAIGQLAIWLVVVMLIFLIPRTTGARLGWFVTLRRLLRRADSLAVIRVVVAAGVVLGVAVSASTAAQSWRVERAKLQIGAPVSYPVQDGALRAYAAAHTADPDGSWLLPGRVLHGGPSEWVPAGVRRGLAMEERCRRLLRRHVERVALEPAREASRCALPGLRSGRHRHGRRPHRPAGEGAEPQPDHSVRR